MRWSSLMPWDRAANGRFIFKATGPRWGAGLVVALLVSPLLLIAAVAVVASESTMPVRIGSALAFLVLAAIPGHFLYGYRAPLILPSVLFVVGVCGVLLFTLLGKAVPVLVSTGFALVGGTKLFDSAPVEKAREWLKRHLCAIFQG
jgi:hypothetical protein